MTSLLLVLALQASAEVRKERLHLAAGMAAKDMQPILQKFAASGIREILLRVDGAVPFAQVQEVMALAREAGIEKMQFSSDKVEAHVKLVDAPRKSLRIKVQQSPKGLEVFLLRESAATSLDDLKAQLAGLEKTPIVLDADRAVSYDAIKQIVESCKSAGFDKVSFAGRKPVRVYFGHSLESFIQGVSGVETVFNLAESDVAVFLESVRVDKNAFGDYVMAGGHFFVVPAGKELDPEVSASLKALIRSVAK